MATGKSRRGVETIIIAHITFPTAFVAVVVQSRLVDSDISIEEPELESIIRRIYREGYVAEPDGEPAPT